jgi:hypothetical protein
MIPFHFDAPANGGNASHLIEQYVEVPYTQAANLYVRFFTDGSSGVSFVMTVTINNIT